MSTIQIVGIAVAAVIVLLLVIALIVTRKTGEDGSSESQTESGAPSFLDSPPSDTLARLGKPEHDSEPAVDAATGQVTAAGVGAESGAQHRATAGASADLGLEWDHGLDESPGARQSTADETETTGEIPATEAATAASVATQGGRPHEDAVGGAEHGEAGAGAAHEQTAEAAPGANLVPLSSIIVTTSTKMVDLEDPEIRRMLTELVTFEIDQATQFREHGQMIDAVLQLTEAEKICRALGKQDTAREIRDMMRGLQV